jgi:hypothetical protein
MRRLYVYYTAAAFITPVVRFQGDVTRANKTIGASRGAAGLMCTYCASNPSKTAAAASTTITRLSDTSPASVRPISKFSVLLRLENNSSYLIIYIWSIYKAEKGKKTKKS